VNSDNAAEILQHLKASGADIMGGGGGAGGRRRKA
jgi:hypothetical protein